MNEQELREQFVKKAISYVGVKEGSAQHKSIVDTYNQIKPLPSGYKLKYTDPWCAGYVSTIASLCKLLDIIPAECSCGRMIALAKKMGIWVENDAYVPKVGDAILYDWNDSGSGDNTGDPEHIGIVVSVSNGVIKIVEGNYHDAVGYRNIAVNGRYIRGYIAFNFASKATSSKPSNSSSKEMCKVELAILRKGSKGNSVKALQALLVGFGYNVGKSGIDGDFGNATLSAVKKYQAKKGLEVDGVVGSATWTSLLK